MNISLKENTVFHDELKTGNSIFNALVLSQSFAKLSMPFANSQILYYMIAA